MDLRDLVDALVSRDALRARQWVADAARAEFDWTRVAEPPGLDPLGLAVAAAVVEMMAERQGKPAGFMDGGGSCGAPPCVPGAGCGIAASSSSTVRGRGARASAPAQVVGPAGVPDRRLKRGGEGARPRARETMAGPEERGERMEEPILLREDREASRPSP